MTDNRIGCPWARTHDTGFQSSDSHWGNRTRCRSLHRGWSLDYTQARSPGTCRCRHTAHRYRPQDTLGLRGMYHPRWDHSRRRRRLRGKKVVYRDNPCPRCIRYMRLSPNMSPHSGTPHHFGNHDITPHRCRMVVVANRTRARQASRRDRSHRYRAVCSRHNRQSQHTVAEAQGRSPGSPYTRVHYRPHHRSHCRAHHTSPDARVQSHPAYCIGNHRRCYAR